LITTIILGVFSILFAYLAKFGNFNWGLKVSFVLIFLFLAFRYAFGNDYNTYLDIFNDISIESNVDYSSFIDQTFEPGWLFLNWLFRNLGFFTMNILLALISCLVYYRFIKKYVPAQYYWFAIFIYIFNPNLMLIHSSAMRQSVAILLIVFSLEYFYKKDFIRYFICVVIASLFHYSALILLPVFLLTYLNKEIGKKSGGIIFALYILLFVFGDKLIPYFSQFVSQFFEKYDYYQDKGIVNSGLGFLFYSLTFILVLYTEKFQNREVALIFKLCFIYFLIMPLGIIIEMTGRFGMYFAVTTIIVYPNIINCLKSSVQKYTFAIIIILFTVLQFGQFFYSDIYHEYYINYQTVFSAPKWY